MARRHSCYSATRWRLAFDRLRLTPRHRSTVFAILLGKLLPQRDDTPDRYGRDIGWCRVVRRMHTPQDIYAVRVLGQALTLDFLASPAPKCDLDTAASELASVGFAGEAVRARIF